MRCVSEVPLSRSPTIGRRFAGGITLELISAWQISRGVAIVGAVVRRKPSFLSEACAKSRQQASQ